MLPRIRSPEARVDTSKEPHSGDEGHIGQTWVSDWKVSGIRERAGQGFGRPHNMIKLMKGPDNYLFLPSMGCGREGLSLAIITHILGDMGGIDAWGIDFAVAGFWTQLFPRVNLGLRKSPAAGKSATPGRVKSSCLLHMPSGKYGREKADGPGF